MRLKWGAKDTDEMTKREKEIMIHSFVTGLPIGALIAILVMWVLL